MTEKEFRMDLFRELGWVATTKLNRDLDLTENKLQVVMTLVEEVKNLGYIFNPNSIELMGYLRDSDLEELLEDIREFVGNVKAKPMYPDFPKQVMEMSESTFRLHQMIHYFSTYGLESIGLKVEKGWLPEVEETEKIEMDESLLDKKVIRLLPMDYCKRTAFEIFFQKRERMTIPERAIVSYAFATYVYNNPAIDISKIYIPFKENMCVLFEILFEKADKNINDYHFCQHTGDVLKCIQYIFDNMGSKKHLRTSQKKLLVKILESYSAEDFKANLIISNKSAENAKILLQYLDYNKYSRSDAHKSAVWMLRNNKLKSWEGKAKALLFSKDNGAINFIAQRPGMLLRMITILLRNGYKPDSIKQALIDNSSVLSTNTLVTLNTYFNKSNKCIKKCRSEELYDYTELIIMRDILKDVLINNLKLKLNTVLSSIADKKIFIDPTVFDLDKSIIECNAKSEEGGMRSGLAYKIPSIVRYMRFFVYWNDKHRVDIDLHAFGFGTNGEKIKIGYNSDYNVYGIVFSGDITHSDAAEYIDVDLNNDVIDYVSTYINVFDGAQSFGDIDECFTGVMGVNNINENCTLYDPKNCFYTHYLKSGERTLKYGFIDVKSRTIIFVGKPSRIYDNDVDPRSDFSVQQYLNCLQIARGLTFVSNKEEADVIFKMGNYEQYESSIGDKEIIDLLENNFFMD